MCYEIETKLKVASLDQVREKLTAMGASFIEQQLQHDYYLDDKDGRLRASDVGLRIRHQKGGNGEKVWITYKGPHQTSHIKTRKELEVLICDDLEKVKAIFTALGYHNTIVVRKNRMLWQFHQCMITLDTVTNLGTFVEIEGPDSNRIDQVKEALGLAKYEHISQGYARMLANAEKSQPNDIC